MRGRWFPWLAGLAAVVAGVVWATRASAASRRERLPAPGQPPPLPEGGPLRPQGARGLVGAKVLLVGDSLAVGLATPMAKIAAESGANFAAKAKGSTTIVQWSKGPFEQALDEERPDLVVIVLGTNDSAARDVSQSKAALSKMLEQAGRRSVPVYWVGVPTLPPRLVGAESMRQAIRDAGVPVYPSETLEFQRTPDKVHATGGGYATWASAVWSWLGTLVGP